MLTSAEIYLYGGYIAPYMNSWVQIETGTEKKNNNNNNSNNLLISTENKNVYRKFLKNVTFSTRQASAKK